MIRITSIPNNISSRRNASDIPSSPRFDAKTQKNLRREVSDARRDADELLKRLDDLQHRVGRPREDRMGGTGAAGSAEDLL